MPFFNPADQQRLMSQMFQNPQGGPMPPQPGGQGGVGQTGPVLGPSFVGPGDEMGGMPADLGVEAPDQFNLPVPNIGDEAMLRQPPGSFNDPMQTGGMPSGMGGGGAAPEEIKRRLIEAIMARQSGAI